jgi:hypothetical protein
MQLKHYRKFGAVGKLHNIVLHVRWNPERRRKFESIQRRSNNSIKVYQLVVDGGIRWNSTYDMIERGKQAI